MAGTIETTEAAQAEADGLDRPATNALITALYHENLLNPGAFFRAREMLTPERHWRVWIDRILLILGAVLTLAGVIFFFAYNWADLPVFAKFALIEAAILGCAIAAWWCKLETLAGKAFMMASAILVGVLLAVFGQAYPTGADAYNLFGGWALLITAWVLVARAPAMWFLWMLLWNLTLWFYWDHGRMWWIRWDISAMGLSIAGLNAAFVIFIESGERFGWKWLNARWLRGVLLMAVYGALIVPIEHIIFSWTMSWPLESLAASAAALGMTYWYYRYREPDLFALAIGGLFACSVLSSILIRFLIFDRFIHGTPEAIALLFTGMCIVGIFAAAVFVLKAIARTMPDSAVGADSETPAGNSEKKDVGKAAAQIPTMRTLLKYLQDENKVDIVEGEAIRNAMFKSRNEKPTPWYLHAMIAVGAWWAALCFFGFVALILGDSVLRESGTAICMGMVWVGVAVFMSRAWDAIFFAQLALAMSGAGHTLILFGVAQAMGYRSEAWTMAATACLLCAILNGLYRTATHRFLSTLLALSMVFVAATERHMGMNLMLGLILALEAGAVGVLFVHSQSPSRLRPVAFAAAVMLPVTFHVLSHDHFPMRLWYSGEDLWWPANLVMIAMMVALIWYLTHDTESGRKLRLPLVAGAVVLGVLSGVGLLIGTGLMALGYARRERIIVALGIASLSTFLFYYYYNMDVDLMSKSFVLAGGGVCLLLLRIFTRVRSDAKEVPA